MEETKAKILAYLQERYKRTGWQFYRLANLQYEFGKDVKDACNALRKEGILKRRDGVTGVLVEYIPEEQRVTNQ